MYLSNLKLFNFRRFQAKNDGAPGLSVDFQSGLNIIVGENDSGKTAIIDAIRLLLGTVSDDFQPITDDDFFYDGQGNFADSFQIQGLFTKLSKHEAGIFLEWLSFDDHGEYELKLTLTVEKRKNSNDQAYLERSLVAGDINAGSKMSSVARSFIKATYLKALRNASDELTPGFRSHLPQMLRAHSSFHNNQETERKLISVMEKANKEIETFFAGADSDKDSENSINGQLNEVLSKLYDHEDEAKSKTSFKLPQASLNQILKQLSLNPDSVNLGLGNMNLLFIATELALLNDHVGTVQYGPNITLVEELEAHLHVQAQIRLIKYIEEYMDHLDSDVSVQFILTSHSIALTASVDQRSLIYLHGGVAYPMGPSYTRLESKDYAFLNRFLDATKCNLFFAKGLILVEGYSENLLLPELANLIGMPLHRNGVSIVNVGGRIFENYVKLFSRQQDSEEVIPVPIAIVRDSDIRPYAYRINSDNRLAVEKLVSDSISLDEDKIGKDYPTLNKLSKAFKLDFLESKRKQLDRETRQQLSVKELTTKQLQKSNELKEKYSDYNAKTQTSVSPAWTLEYSLLLSPLRDLLVRAMVNTMVKRSGEREEKTLQIEKALNDKPLEEAQSLYESFGGSSASKSETAQYLATEISELSGEERGKLKEKVLNDSYCKYLVDAIKFASGKFSEGNGDGEAD